MTTEEGDEGQWDVKFREDEEMEFFTELALHEAERWITAVTKKPFAFPEDTRKSLENGILLCELLNNIKPGSVKRINKLPTPIAGLDNLHVFLRACKEHFGLNDTYLFDPSDLEDLSQRAIAESEHLKEELDRRLRNVAITVYWIGRVAAQIYQGPKIDQSAFAALVHNQHRHREHIVSDGQLRRDSACSWENSSHSSIYGSNEGGNSRGIVKETTESKSKHARDGSYDSYTSYGKGSEDSLDESVFEVDENGMPIPRYGSSSALNNSRDGRGSNRESIMYSTEKNSNLYRSSPDLSHSTLSNRRSSSMDSTDGSSGHGGGHSRQSSDSVEYPTRRLSTSQAVRKTSVSADPLQFIKVKGATDLAVTAEEQIKLAAETKKLKITGSISEDDNTDWQSNLASWKNRRKSHSEKSYQLKEELEQMEREKEETKPTSSQATKTFSQMQAEREKRKSVGSKHFYPIEDEGEDDIFVPATASQQQSSPASRTSSRFQSATPKEELKDSRVSSRSKDKIAGWAQNSASEEEEDEEQKEVSHSGISNNRSAAQPEARSSRFSRDNDSNATATRQRRSGMPTTFESESRDSWQKSRSDTGQQSAFKENNRNSANNMSSSKSSNKISNILKSFEHKEEDDARPKSSVNSSVDVGARKKSFENFGARSSGVDSYRSWSTDHREEASSQSRGRSSQMISSGSSSVYASSRSSGKDYVEKTIKISQKPNNIKGFGFTLSGGADRKQPVVVEKVGLGSAADVCEVLAKDEVVSINGQSVARMTSMELSQKVQDAVRDGQIELKVKRFLGSGDDFEDEDFLSSDEMNTPDRSVSKSPSVHAENSFDSLDSRDGRQKTDVEPERQWIEDVPANITTQMSTRRGDPTSTSSDSGYDAQTFSPYHRGDNSSNEEEIIPAQQQETEQPKRPSLAARTRGLYPQDDDEDDYVNLRVTNNDQNTYKEDHAEKALQREVIQSQGVEVEFRPSIPLRRERNLQRRAEEEEENKPVISYEAHVEVSTTKRDGEKYIEQNDGDDSDSGPPAALRKWQRQRPRAEYTFESDDTPPPKFYDQIKFSASQSRQTENSAIDTNQGVAVSHVSQSSDDTMPSQATVEVTRRSFNIGEERRRMLDWNKQQEEDRQPEDQLHSGYTENAVEITLPYEQQRFTADREKIQHQYHADLQRARDVERQKQEEERQMLEPEIEKMRLLEERRAQRQARLQMYSQDFSADFAAPNSGSSTRSSLPQLSEQTYSNIEPTQSQTSTFVTQIQGGKSTSGPSEVLIIDPRNRGASGEPVEISQPGQPLQFQLKINSRETPQGLLIQPEVIPSQHAAPPLQQDHKAFLEAERERIRQEELQKIEMERGLKEQEENQRIHSREEQLRQQEEKLQRQQEELRKSQERLEQERQQLQHQQQYMGPPPNSQTDFAPQEAGHDSLQFETVTSKVRGGSPAYKSTIIAGPRRSDNRPQALESNQEPAWNSSRSQNSSWRGNSQPVSSSQSSLPKWPPAGGEQGSGHGSSQGPSSRQYSRDDMVAMNRKPTPLQVKPPAQSLAEDYAEISNAVKREAPSKDQIHSLNSVPKAKFRGSDQWIGEDPSRHHDRGIGEGRAPPVAPRRSETYRNQFAGPQDHWLVQEAERRRMNDSYNQGPSRAQFSGPIKPVKDSYGNRWSEKDSDVRLSPNMPAQIRQTLLQKTAGARGSTASSSSQEMNPHGPSPTHYSNSSAGQSQTMPPNYTYGSGYQQRPRPEAVPPQHQAPSPDDRRENGSNVSGKQRCSHCSQELGFGAAMVIESLGLYYHTQCFKCCVCRTPLGNGVEGADVRVRVNKLHCPNCYSNDEAGLKFSKV